jgi:GntR family transcriptional regulator
LIQLNYRDPSPIYLQIKDGIRRLIATGVIQEGERLPSVRALASQLAINPNTIQRAYNELEAEEIIISIPGKGSFAAEKPDRDTLRRQELLQKLQALLQELRTLGVTEEELQALLQGGTQHD